MTASSDDPRLRPPHAPFEAADPDLHLEPLSALVDGEPVDPATLAVALAQPGAQEFLLDAVRLRLALDQDTRQLEGETARSVADRLNQPRPWWRRDVELPLPLAAALAVVVAGLLWWGSLTPSAPTHDVVVSSGGDVIHVAPAPTRVLQFEPGVDWQNR